MTKKKIYRILIHFAFWTIYVVSYSFVASYGRFDLQTQIEMHLLYLPVVMLATYFTIYFLIPNFLLKKKYLQLFIYFLISFLLFGLLERANVIFIVIPLYFPESTEQYQLISFGIISRTMNTYYVVFVASAVKLVKHWYNTQQLTQQLQKEKLESELSFLKSQIHPHFLFNTLNNLYVLTLKKSAKAPEIVLKLSDLLSFMLYDCNSTHIPVAKEIENIKNYIELEKIRHGNELQIEFKNELDPANKFIPPLLLLPLVENAFKHGVSKGTGNKNVKINVYSENSLFVFSIINSVDSFESIKETNSGIGLNNLRRRLELEYKDKYDLSIEKDKTFFSVKLKLHLTNNSK